MGRSQSTKSYIEIPEVGIFSIKHMHSGLSQAKFYLVKMLMDSLSPFTISDYGV